MKLHTYNLPNLAMSVNPVKLFHTALVNGHLDEAIRIRAEYSDAAPYEETFSTICGTGNISVAEWFVAHYPDYSYCGNLAFMYAGQSGHGPMAKWLLTRYHIDEEYKLEAVNGSETTEITPWLLEQLEDASPFIFERGLWRVCSSAVFECNYQLAGWLVARYDCISECFSASFDNFTNDAAAHPEQWEMMWWALSQFTPEKFWTDEVQEELSVLLLSYMKNWMLPKRAEFMQLIAPHLPPIKN